MRVPEFLTIYKPSLNESMNMDNSGKVSLVLDDQKIQLEGPSSKEHLNPSEQTLIQLTIEL